MIRDVIAKILSTGPWVRGASLAGLGATLLPSLSFGLGLGDIQVESRLNQPLYARVEVVDVSDDDWHQIRARIAAPTLLGEGSVHPEILASLTLRAVEDDKGRHFIEVKSGEVLTEPLFDLPVAIAAQSLQVVRNYSVLLDPATSEDAPRVNPAALVAQATGGASRMEASGQAVAVARVDTQAHTPRPHRARVAHNHSKASRKVANVANRTAAAHPQVPDAPATATATSGQEQLEAQLATLQQTLTTMQATITSQNVEIAKLTAQVAARGESSASRRPSTWVEYPALKTPASTDDEGDARSGWFGARSTMFYWIGGAAVCSVVLTLGVVTFLRWRHAKMLREIVLNEAARRQAPPKPAVAPTSERDLLAWQSNLRAAQSGKWKQSLEDTYDPTSEVPSASGSTITYADLESALSRNSSAQSSAAGAATAFATEDTVAVTATIEELTQDLEADLESLNASYEAEHLESTSGGMAAWRAQNEMLERDYLSDTEAPAANDSAGTRTESGSGFVEKVAI